MVTSNQFPAAQNSNNLIIAAQQEVNKTNTMGIIVYLAGRPNFISITDITSNVMPASIWLVDPKRGQIDKPPEPEAPPAPNASNKQEVTAIRVAAKPFLNKGIPYMSPHS